MRITTYLNSQQEEQIEHWECPLCHSTGKSNWWFEVVRTYVMHDAKGQPTIEVHEGHCKNCGVIMGHDDDGEWFIAVVIDERR